LVCFDAVRSQRLELPAMAVDCLSLLSEWTSAEDLLRRQPDLGTLSSTRALLRKMSSLGLVERDRDASSWLWEAWSPEAAFFHFGTRGGSYPVDAHDYDVTLRKKAKHDPPPAPTKSVRGRRITLSPPADVPGVSSVLRERRTWRNFSQAPVRASDLSTLLQLTWGVQKWGVVRGQSRVPLKTSPSGGARHSIEAYVLARNVRGLAAGVYHYDSASHQLVDLRRTVSRDSLTQLLARQSYYGHAAAAIVMSAVFARAMWRYPYSKSFRSVLTEAGHLGQTFCLTATAMGLAPFCTMAFHERDMDDLIRVDGVNEAALYVVGVGTRSTRHARQPGRLPPGAPE
jgi:SagB-type dehydrogenase family enzyme